MTMRHVIVDGSNIATEGRDAPSLAQLDEAVTAFIEEYAPEFVTVVVDATFPNRIDANERQRYEDAVNANELITPPAGAIGRGDAFVLQIARRAEAAILSNDSFQEFHGEYPWLFEKGRLLGGKPVPHVGWVFMERAPVRGPTSRRAVSEARKVAKAVERVATSAAKSTTKAAAKSTTKAAAKVAAGAGEPEEAKPARKRRSRAKSAEPTTVVTVGDGETGGPAPTDGDTDSRSAGRTSRGPAPYNEALPFIDFVGRHPVGSEVDAVVERFSSHGVYVMVGDARAYLPLRNLAEPAPRSAKEMLRVGETRRFVVVAIDPPRRGIDLAVPGMVEVPAAPAAATGAAEALDEIVAAATAEPARRARRAAGRKAAGRKAAAKVAGEVAGSPVAAEAAEGEAAPRARRAAGRKAAAKVAAGAGSPAEVAEVEPPPRARRAAGRKAAAKVAAGAGSPAEV
ncbi:MAG TPA: S1 RNA-binding domain-containing protein, partial [Acidimicrobiales bacterium]|nr:S1 RNA-binding domain-containing protein [Acidimicrobiales bacterium]